ncbi:MAG: thiamine pyrophosphate-dependent enzyme, partial [Planctomycetota bacterium]|nr:thiamine pyrophosphate-dependent enzyme [Planctomycetota bacterium]
GEGPSLIVLHTYRMLGHSSSDDPTKYRDDEEVAAWAELDPIDRFESFLIKSGILSDGERSEIEAELITEIDAVIHEQEAAESMPLATLVEDVYAEVPRHLKEQYNAFLKVESRYGEAERGEGEFPL